MHNTANPFAQVAHYFQVAFDLPQGAAEQVDHAFDDIALAASAFEVDEAADRWHCELLFNQPPDMEEVTRRVMLLATIAGVKMPAITTATIAQQDWLSLVARNFPPLVIERFFVHGSHVTEAAPISAIPIQVEAGAAFGSGEHGTTRCCLQGLAWIHRRRKHISCILDMGTGSGILAIAAAKLWDAKILAVDIDPIAVQVTADNVRINNETQKISCAVSDGYKSSVVQRFGMCDLVIANILARPLVSFAPYLARALKDGGYCVLSGLLIEQENMVFAAHRMQGLKLVQRFTHEGWCTLVLQK